MYTLSFFLRSSGGSVFEFENIKSKYGQKRYADFFISFSLLNRRRREEPAAGLTRIRSEIRGTENIINNKTS